MSRRSKARAKAQRAASPTRKAADSWGVDVLGQQANVPQTLSPVLDLVRGLGLDSIATRFRQIRELGFEEIRGLYQDGIARRIIDLPVDHALGQWPTIWVEDERFADARDQVERKAERLKVPTHFRRFAKFRSLDGWALLANGYADLQPSQPAPWGYSPLLWVRELWRWDTTVQRIYGPDSPRVGEPRLVINYRIRPNVEDDRYFAPGLGVINGSRFTRWATLDGRSDLERVAKYLADLLGGGSGTAALLNRASLGVYKIKDWRQKVMRDEATAYAVVQAQHQALSTLNALVLDSAQEEFEQLSTGALGGAGDAVYALSWLLAAAAGIPMTLLYGMSPGGFSSGEDEQRFWHMRLSALRQEAEEHLRLVYDALFAEVLHQPAVPRYGFVWPPLRTLDAEEQATLVTSVMGAADTAIASGYTTRRNVIEGLSTMPELDLWKWTAADDLGEEEEAGTDLAVPEKLALNGAQITSFVEVLQSVSSGQIAPEAALALLRVSFPATPTSLLERAVAAQQEAREAVPIPASPTSVHPAPSPTGADEGETVEDEPEPELPAAPWGTWLEAAAIEAAHGISARKVKALGSRRLIGRRKIGSRWEYRLEDVLAAAAEAVQEPIDPSANETAQVADPLVES